jgi:glycerol uptake facilitator-like aquaporin
VPSTTHCDEYGKNNLLTHHPFRFVGTFLFLFFAFSATQVANAASAGEAGGGSTSSAATGGSGDGGLTQAPNTASLSYISLAFGFSLAVNAWVFFRVSGGLFNPAVTLGMALIGAMGWVRATLIFIAQILGSLAASGVVDGLFPGPLSVSTTLGGGTSVVQGLCKYSPCREARALLTVRPFSYRDVLDFPARHHHLPARCGKAQGNVLGTHRHRTFAVHCRAVGCILHWR